jgi:hypothetical protein
MKSFALISTIVLAICATALSQTPGPEVGKFELNPAAPPSPALKYQLVFEDSSSGKRRYSLPRFGIAHGSGCEGQSDQSA